MQKSPMKLLAKKGMLVDLVSNGQEAVEPIHRRGTWGICRDSDGHSNAGDEWA